MTRAPIPFNRPSFVGHERRYMEEALALGHVSGDGEFTRRCSELLREQLGVAAALLTTSCTHALEMAAILLDIAPGDEVIIPVFTFVSTANAFVLRGARPVFVDIRPDTLNLDERQLARHLAAEDAGDRSGPLRRRRLRDGRDPRHRRPGGIAVVEDNAHGLFGARGGKALGTWGALATLSLPRDQELQLRRGRGAPRQRRRLIERAEIIREKGTNRKRFFRGQVDKYTWVDIGSSYLPSDLLAAFLYGQLEQKASVLAARRRIHERYREGLAGWAEETGVALPTIPPDCASSYHMFHLVMPTPDARARLIAGLRARDILSVFHYLPLHLSEMGRRWGGRPGDCPVAESVSERLVRLPFYTSLTEADQHRVIDAVLELR